MALTEWVDFCVKTKTMISARERLSPFSEYSPHIINSIFSLNAAYQSPCQ